MTIRKLKRLLGRADSVWQRCLGVQAQEPEPPTPTEESVEYLTGSPVPTDTVLVNDVSDSMGSCDCRPSRLEASKNAAETYVRQRVGISPQDRIGVVAFYDCARVILPLTPIAKTQAIINGIKKLKVGGGTDIPAGLRGAGDILHQQASKDTTSHRRNKHILMLTDGHGGHPLRLARQLKAQDVLIEVIGIGGNPAAVKEDLLRKVATTDDDGFTHYWFINDADRLVNHYRQLATGIVKG